jgi:D-alanine-D-alanine ligase
LNELKAGIEAALEHDRFALVERYIKATEVHVGILDGRVLGCIEVAPRAGLYDYEAKYTPGKTEYIMPPRIAPTRARGVMNLAERAVRALGCTGACRVDLLVTEGENEYVLEVNTLPGMTPTSLLPKIADSAGMDYGTLCEAILDGATLHASLARPKKDTRESGVTFTEKDLELVKKAV